MRSKVDFIDPEKANEMRKKFFSPEGLGYKFKVDKSTLFNSKNDYQKIKRNQELPQEIRNYLKEGIKGNLTKEEIEIIEDLRENFAEGNYYIVPGFFRMLMTLQKQKRNFIVVFRTFGEDLPKIVKEFN